MVYLEAVKLAKKIGDKQVLENVTFGVGKGEIIGLLGPNGAGKTTTMRILMGLLRPDSGSAKVAGFDVFEDTLEVRRLVGYLPENPCLYERLTVWDNLAFYGELYGVQKDELETRINRLLDTMGLKGRAFSPAGNLSKGLKQRVAIARALVHDPPILLLDQPTSDLDPVSASFVRELIKKLNRSGKTILICTHNLIEAEQLCSRIAVINEGRIVAIGSPSKLRKESGEGYTFEIKSLKPIKKYLNVLRETVGESYFEIEDELSAVVRVGRLESISHLIRNLVSAGCELVEVRMLMPSLEDVYLKLVRES